VYRSASFDRFCRMNYDVLLTGRDPLRIKPEFARGMKASLLERAAEVYWHGAVRTLLREEPEVLD
jgi:hypothetical protein